MMDLRTISPVLLPAKVRSKVRKTNLAELGDPPEFMWISIDELRIDDQYQRDISRASLAVIGRIAQHFSWKQYQPPIVCRSSGFYKVIDGQHTATAAATIGLERIPCLVVDSMDLEEQASVFVGRNTTRTSISRYDIYRARILSGESVSVQTNRLCKEIGIRIRVPAPNLNYRVGDTGSVSMITNMVRQFGVGVARTVLSALVLGERAPITTVELQAALRIVCRNKDISPKKFGEVIKRLGTTAVDKILAESKEKHIGALKILTDRYVQALREDGLKVVVTWK